MTTAPGPHAAPGDRKLLRLEVRNAATPIERKPPWIKTRLRMGPEFTALKSLAPNYDVMVGNGENEIPLTSWNAT